MAVVAATCLGGAVWIPGARVAPSRVRDLRISDAEPVRLDARGLLGFPRDPQARTATTALALAVAMSIATVSPVPMALGLPLAAFCVRRRARGEALREADAVCRAIAELATAMVGELRAGQPPAEAFVYAVGTLDGTASPPFAEAVAVARMGGDVPQALIRASDLPGADALRRIAACWRVAAERGAGFAAALDRVATGLGAEDAAHRELAAELAGARATARLLAGLPLFGVLLGTGMGANPLDILLRTPFGIACLALGLTLTCAGLAWTDRIADQARGGRWTP
jgi:tight adherence protein B